MSHKQKTQRGLILSSTQRAHALTAAAEPVLMTTYVFPDDGLFRLASSHRDFERNM